MSQEVAVALEGELHGDLHAGISARQAAAPASLQPRGHASQIGIDLRLLRDRAASIQAAGENEPDRNQTASRSDDAPSSLDVGGDLNLQHLVRIGRRCRSPTRRRLLQLVHHVHAGHDIADHGVFAVEEGAHRQSR